MTFSARGYSDAKAGRGFPPEYDGWPHSKQVAYEEGRLRFAGRARR